MFRKSTALMFMLVMTLLITLKHPVLGYCMCERMYVAGDISCPVKDSAACSCCENSDDTEPCDDCMKHLNIDVGSFLWSGIDELPVGSENITPPLLFASIVDFDLTHRFLNTPLDTRGDPPLGLNASDSSAPIFLRNSALRL